MLAIFSQGCMEDRAIEFYPSVDIIEKVAKYSTTSK